MKKSLRLLSLLLILCITLTTLTGCDMLVETFPFLEDILKGEEPEIEVIDYTGELKLDTASNTKKQQVTVRYYIDGDTTHFYPNGSTNAWDVMKARYLGVDTPESTGAIEEWGKAASRFTEEKLSTAVSIIIESDDDKWNQDGNGRDLLWIWYQPSKDAEYRLLNLELCQEGLGYATDATEGRYAEKCWEAYMQAEKLDLYIHSNAKDPDYPYDAAIPVTIKELRTNIKEYLGKNVSIEGISNYNGNQTSYLEEYDPETDMYYAIQVFYGYASNRIDLFTRGNKVRVVGTVMDFHGTYQISNITYNPLRPNDPANSVKLSSGNAVGFKEVTAEQFNSVVEKHPTDSSKDIYFGDLSVSSSISMKDLVITRVTTTSNPESANYGAHTITCKQGNYTIKIRTLVFKDAEGNLIPASYFAVGSTISVRGVIDYYDPDSEDDEAGQYQIKAYALKDIVFE